MKKYALIVKDHDLIPEVAKQFFPSEIDGYAFLIVTDEGPVEFWRYSFGDSHPWKNYQDHQKLIDRISRKEAANILRSVRGWNSEFKRRQAIKAAEADKRKSDYLDWLDQFPSDFMNLNREDNLLIDDYGNEIVNLLFFFPKSVAEVKQQIIELFEEGGIGD